MNSPMHSRADASKAPLSLGLQDLSGEQRRGCSVLSARTSSMPGGVLKPLYKASIRKLNIQATRTRLNIISLACRRSSRREPDTADLASLVGNNSPESPPQSAGPSRHGYRAQKTGALQQRRDPGAIKQQRAAVARMNVV